MSDTAPQGITIAEVDQAEAALQEAKKAAYEDKNEDTLAALQEAKLNVVAVRQAFRTQEVEAGRRGTGFAGGDATPSEGA